MSHDEQPPTITITGNEQLGQFLGGMLDVLVAFGAALANAGVLQRADIVAEMDKVLGQQHGRDGGQAAEATQIAPLTMRRFFSRQVVSGAIN